MGDFNEQAEGFAEFLDVVHEVLAFELHRVRGRLGDMGLAEASGELWKERVLGGHRNLVRRLGSSLTFIPNHARIVRHFHPSPSFLCDDDNDNQRRERELKVAVSSLADVGSLADLGNSTLLNNPEIHQRCVYLGPPVSPRMEDVEDPILGGPRFTRPRVSTPIFDDFCGPEASSTRMGQVVWEEESCNGNASAAVDPEEMANLRSELEILKAQMAALIHARQPPTLPPSEERRLSGSSDSGISAPEIVESGKSAPPPPPPPPLPAALFTPKRPLLRGSSKPNTPLGKENVKSGPKAAAAKAAGVPSMSDVLKDLGTVKLRPVGARGARPAGLGTGDVGAFLAEALRRKFAGARGAEDSPSSERADSSWADSSPEPSPFKKPCVRRRSSLAPLGQNGANIPPSTS